MGEYRRKFGVYSAWNYELEVEDLNRMSEQGWQLIKGGCFSNKFKKNNEIQYRYQLDYRPQIEDMGRYIETYREQGWEYVNSIFNGWHYFRKLYAPGTDEREYEIFTDTASLNEMNKRWAMVGSVAAGVFGIYTILLFIHLVMQPSLHALIGLLSNATIFFIFFRAVSIMKNPEGNRKNRKDKWMMLALVLALLIGPTGSITLAGMRPYFPNAMMQAEYFSAIPANPEEAVDWLVFDVNYPDFYYLSLDINAEKPVCILLINEKQEIIYTVTGSDFEEEGVRLLLEKGNYQLSLSDFAGGAFDMKASLK
jgi:hypothetical protein